MTATKRPRAQRAGCHDAMLLLAACCGVKLLLVAVLVAVAAGPWALGILVALLGGLGVALARARRTRACRRTQAVLHPETRPYRSTTDGGTPVGVRDGVRA